MNNSQFQQLKQYVGTRLLTYFLDVDEIACASDFDSLNLHLIQVQCLDDLFARIQQCRIQFIIDGGYGDGLEFHLRRIRVNGSSLFNHYRMLCGGVFPSVITSDPLIAFLQNVCIHEYPNLLMKSISNLNSFGHHFLNIGLDHYNKFIALVKNDALDSLTNHKEQLEYAFQFETTDGLKFSLQVCTACSVIISRSFYSACNKMSYSVEAVMKEIEDSVNLLRDLARGEEVEYSGYIGIRGLNFIGYRSISLGSHTLRQFDDISNPSLHTNRTIVSYSNNNETSYSGHILETRHRTAIRRAEGSVNHSINFDQSSSTQTYQIQEDVLRKLKFSVTFSTLATRGLVPSYYEIAFPLVDPGNSTLNDGSPGEYIDIDSVTKLKLEEWFNALSSLNLNTVKTPLKRLQYAIFERRDPEDAIVDAIISWEGMFSEAFETTFKVTGSMAKFLRVGEERQHIYSRLKKLYGLRSDLVHGKSSKLLINENIHEVRDEVIDIAIECMMKILKNNKLLAMTPSERVNYLLVLEEPSMADKKQDHPLD